MALIVNTLEGTASIHPSSSVFGARKSAAAEGRERREGGPARTVADYGARSVATGAAVAVPSSELCPPGNVFHTNPFADRTSPSLMLMIS